MKPREYCCCAIPVIYVGIYSALLEQFALGILAGTLSVATTSIVGAVTPSFAKWLFGIICYVGAGIQLLGFAGVRQEKPILFRRYTTLHLMTTLAAFAVAAVWIILSAAKHTQAETNCKNNFYNSTNSVVEQEGDTICKYFPWADIGIMSGLWVLLAIMQVYLYFVLLSYSSGQERDYRHFDSFYDASKPFASDIPLADRSDPWQSRPSTDALVNAGGHGRSDSIASTSTVMGDQMQQSRNLNGYGQTYNPPSQSGDGFRQDAGPTSRLANNQYDDEIESEYSQRSQAHPGMPGY